MEKSAQRLKILKRIDELEAAGLFDHDVEDDPPTDPLLPDQIDYLNKKRSSRVKTRFANFVARKYFDRQIKLGNLVIEGCEGLEYAHALSTGAVITCNHFNPYDNYAVYKCLVPVMKKRMLYKVIREGNYTSFPGLYGFFFRNCNTLPLASNLATMRKFMEAVDVLLRRGENILIYPEQGMWWNYRKPRPLKSGAFRFAVKSNVPVLPCFITMRDSDKLDGDGFPIQKYTLHFLKPIYPHAGLSVHDNAERMALENYEAWKEVYERVYQKKLVYGTEVES